LVRLFGVGPVHKILTNSCYSTGLWLYGKRDSRNGGQHDPSSAIPVPVPILIDIDIAERVLAKLKQNSPKNTPPRVVNGPSLLTGVNKPPRVTPPPQTNQ
jgi:site-specific DNA recombinase